VHLNIIIQCFDVSRRFFCRAGTDVWNILPKLSVFERRASFLIPPHPFVVRGHGESSAVRLTPDSCIALESAVISRVNATVRSHLMYSYVLAGQRVVMGFTGSRSVAGHKTSVGTYSQH